MCTRPVHEFNLDIFITYDRTMILVGVRSRVPTGECCRGEKNRRSTEETIRLNVTGVSQSKRRWTMFAILTSFPSIADIRYAGREFYSQSIHID